RPARPLALHCPPERRILPESGPSRRAARQPGGGSLAGSSMALDVYVWLAQRLHRVAPGKPQFIPWAAAYDQFGQGFGRIRAFRRCFLQTLAHVKSAYPSARIASDEQGLTLEHSPPPVGPRSLSRPLGPKPGYGKLVAPPSGAETADSQDGAAAETI